SLEFIGFSAPSVLTVREFFSAVSGNCSAWISGSPHSVMHNPDRGSSSAYVKQHSLGRQGRAIKCNVGSRGQQHRASRVVHTDFDVRVYQLHELQGAQKR